MKNPMLRGVATAACFWLALTTAPYAQPPGTPESEPQAQTAEPPKQFRVQVEFIDVSHEQLTELMFGPKLPANDGELRQQVAQLIKDGKASILETLLCTASNGQKATTESVEEFIYPTEYERAEVPNDIHFNGKEKDGKAKAILSAPATLPDLATGPTPTAFDTRNLGSTLEIEGTCDNKLISLHLVPEIVYHVGNQVWAEWKGEHGNSPIQMPTFYALRVNTTVTLADGKFMLMAALSPKNKDGFPDFTRKLMVFVKADIITIGH